jgi:hypothetical protein
MTADEGAPPSQSLAPYRAGFYFGAFNGMTWMIGLGTPLVLFAQHLGATAFQVGLASSAVFILLPLQVLSTAMLPRLGYRRQMVGAWLARALFLLIPIGLAIAAPDQPYSWMVNLLVASVFGFCFFRAVGVAAHIPWFSGFLPSELRGRFWATEQSIVSLVGVGTLLTCAALFEYLPPYPAFRIAYGVSLAGALLASFNLLRLPDVPPPTPIPVRSIGSQARVLCTRPGVFRHYLILVLLGSIVTSSFGAFSVYYLKVEAGIASSQIMIFTAVQFSGTIVGNLAIRRLIDVVHVKRFFQITSLTIGLVDLFWLFLVAGGSSYAAGIGVAYFFFGLAVGVSNTAHYTYIPELSDVERRPVTIAVFTGVHGLLCGVAPMLWGLLLRKPGAAPGVEVTYFAFYFALGLALNLVLTFLYGGISDQRAGIRS